jgi:hypothetical protein
MKNKPIALFVTFVLISLAAAEMPSSFYQAIGGMKNQDILCVKNYDAGASVTEAYKDFEHLDKDTKIVSRTYNNTSDDNPHKGNASLEVMIDSQVIGKAHIAWQSLNTVPESTGRHPVYSRSAEDLTGVFNIEKFIQLWSNSTLQGLGIDWLPCG